MNYALKEYGAIRAEGEVSGANPHRLITLMLDGALDRLAAARGHMQRGEVAQKGATISKVILIVEGLRAGLDSERGGQIARSLSDLYDYVNRRLLLANCNNDERMLEEVGRLLGEVRSAWVQIPPQGQAA